jgi:hypothetical protein
MDEFIRKHDEVIEGVLSCFDRMLFRGYLPIMSGGAMAEFLQAKGVHRWGLKTFLLTQAGASRSTRWRWRQPRGAPTSTWVSERGKRISLGRSPSAIGSTRGWSASLRCWRGRGRSP